MQITEIRLCQAAAGDRRGRIQTHTEILEHIGRATVGRDRTVAVLHLRQTGLRTDQGDQRRDIDRADAIASGAADVDRLRRWIGERDRGREQSFGRTRDDIHSFPLELEGDQDEIERSLDWVREQNVRVDPVYEDVVEG